MHLGRVKYRRFKPLRSPRTNNLEVPLMSTEGVDSAEAARAQGFPDRTGWKPDNPYLANFRPFIPPNVVIPELTIRAIIVGTLLGIVFGASSLYLVLKVGLTVSASI